MKEYFYLNPDICQALQNWHHGLENNRGDRARLRRAERPEDILLTDVFFGFLSQMPDGWLVDEEMFTGAAVAGLLSHVKENLASDSFAQQLATNIKRQNKAPVSELRFQQLQKSRTTDDFYRRMVRTIRLVEGRANILSLANDTIQWHKEFNGRFKRNPANRLVVRWATEYYTANQNNQK